MKKVAIILAGCGQKDGSEIQETIAALLVLAQENISWDAFAPNILQANVVDHLNNVSCASENRNVLIESARLVRGKVQDLKSANLSNYDGIIIPGGVGVITNLCNYYSMGINFTLQADFAKFIMLAAKEKIPTVFICIAPIMIPKIYPNKVQMTIGNDPTIIKQMQSLGAVHAECSAAEIVIDQENNVISTPANMVAKDLNEVYQGVRKAILAQRELFYR